VRAAIAYCGRQALEDGFDLTAYSAAQMAGDIGDLMTVLPYDQWNLFGVSYGTRVALVTMRRPAGGDPQCHTRFGPAHRWP
jgi:pimeloyl-ACP methyl ester carboxylesterase